MKPTRIAARLLMAGFDGLEAPDYILKLLSQGLAGTILFRRNVEGLEQLLALNGQLLSRGAALLAVDEEGGRVRRLRGITTDLPAMEVLGQRGREDLCYRAGALLGRELAALGFSMNFAPILDVNTNPQNPVIGDRSFARTPEEVIRLALPFARGLQQMGVAACGKHFPGHGDTDTDSHLTLPVLNHDLKRMASVELAPFRAAAQSDLASMMTAHVLVPAWNPDHPSTLDPKALGILRRQYGYQGLIISDDLEMAAIAARYGMAEAVTLGVEAGVDLFLVCRRRDRVEEAFETLVRLAESGPLASKVAAASRRVEATIQRYVGSPSAPPLAGAQAVLKRTRFDLADARDLGLDPTEFDRG